MLVVTGSPGVGKHTVAAVLAARLKLETVDLNNVACEAGLVESDGEVDPEKLSGVLDDIAKDSLVVGHLAPYVLHQEQVSAAIVLRRSPYELETVYEKRSYPHGKRLDNLGSEILGVIAHDALERFGASAIHQIDSTSKSPEETATLAQRALNSDYAGDDIDWLDLIGTRDHMQRFFSY